MDSLLACTRKTKQCLTNVNDQAPVEVFYKGCF